MRTSSEMSDCVSLCGLCHMKKHSGSIRAKALEEQIKSKIMLGIYYEILKQPYYIREALLQHNSFIKSLEIKPNDFFKSNQKGEVEKDGESKYRTED